MEKREPKYSGPNCNGICVCGCSWEDHHMSIVMRQEYIDETGEYYILGECDAFGFNESGGLKWNEETHEFDEHCYQYKDSKLNDKH